MVRENFPVYSHWQAISVDNARRTALVAAKLRWDEKDPAGSKRGLDVRLFTLPSVEPSETSV